MEERKKLDGSASRLQYIPSDETAFHVSYKSEEIVTLAEEIRNGTIAEVHLSLFTYWICEEEENYAAAKRYIRELGLDQSYPTSRIDNPHIRKLVEDIKHLRPEYDYGSSNDSDGDGDDQLLAQLNTQEPRAREHASVRSQFSSLSKLSDVTTLLRSHSDARFDRAPHSLGPKALELLHARQASSPLRPRSPWISKSDSLPAMMAKKKQAESPSPAAAPDTVCSEREYPPNTPDRPAPLDIKPRGPDSAGPPTALLRSASTPVRSQQSPRFACSPQVLRGRTTVGSRSTLEEEEDETAPPRESSVEADGAVFGLLNEPPTRRSNLFATNDIRHGSSNGESAATVGPYELEAHELTESESNSPLALSPSSMAHSDPPAEQNRGTNSQISQDRTMNSEQHSHRPTQNTLANPRSRPFALNPVVAPTRSQRRNTAQARRTTRLPNSSPAHGFHRPLPLRSYESEVFLYPTARAANAAHTRANSLNLSPRRARHSLPAAGDVAEMTRRIGPSNLRVCLSSLAPVPARASSPPLSPSRSTTTSQDSVSLSQFPAPPRDDALALAHSYCVTVSNYLRHLLSQTRARGAQLPRVAKGSVSPFELAWRQVNGELLTAIYGRTDVVLTQADVRLVEKIAKELREGVGRIAGYGWVGEVFRGE